MFTHKTKTMPVPGVEVKQTLDRIEENWSEISDSAADDREVTRMIQRDLFELVGIVKGLMMGAELRHRPAEEPLPAE